MGYKEIPIWIKENSIIPLIKKGKNEKETIVLNITQVENIIEKKVYIKGKKITVKVHKNSKGYSSGPMTTPPFTGPSMKRPE